MAAFSREFRDRFAQFLTDHKTSVHAAAKKADFVVSRTAVANWADGQVPTKDNMKAFMQYFENEDINEWLDIIDRAREAA